MGKSKVFVLSLISLCIVLVSGIIIGMNFFRTYDVNFDAQGGAGVPVMQVKNGELVVKPEDPVMEGYLFLGWYLEDELYDFSSPIKNDITLVGKWQSVIVYE